MFEDMLILLIYLGFFSIPFTIVLVGRAICIYVGAFISSVMESIAYSSIWKRVVMIWDILTDPNSET